MRNRGQSDAYEIVNHFSVGNFGTFGRTLFVATEHTMQFPKDFGAARI
jgi:hypothetical protein